MDRGEFLRMAGLGGLVALVGRGAYAGGNITEVEDLDHSSKDGSYSTITGQFSFKKTGSSLKKVKLKIPGLKEEPPVMASIKSSESPLVVILSGASGKAKEALANAWASWLENKGYNVLTFDSTFVPSMTLCVENEREAAKQGRKPIYGMAGNLESEAGLAGSIVKSFIDSSQLKPVKIGIVGLSYGGLQAALLCGKQQRGELPFKIDGARVFSPVLSMKETTQILDKNFSEEWGLSDLYWEFYNVPAVNPMPQKYASEEGQRKMRVAISRSFFFDLKGVVDTNSYHFRDAVKDIFRDFDAATKALLKERGIDILFDPNSDRMNRLEAAAHVSFNGYVSRFAEPYWRKRGFSGDFFAAGEFGEVLAGAGDEVEVSLARNDPLNYPASLDRFLEGIKGSKKRINLLPWGGHGGYCNSDWARRNIEGIFER